MSRFCSALGSVATIGITPRDSGLSVDALPSADSSRRSFSGMHDSVTVHTDAPPEKIWALVSDVTKIGLYSPETFEAEWLDGATGPAEGARFRGHVKRNGKGPVYWTTCTVMRCEPGKEFAFGVGSSDRPLNVWSYTLAPDSDGTDVTESFQLAP